MAFNTCFCENVEFQTYAHTVGMKCPHIKRKDGWVCIDVCIASEIAELWHKGIRTLNSCCGHQKHRSWVIVDEESSHNKLMEKLGYSFYIAPSGMKAFYLKTGTHNDSK